LKRSKPLITLFFLLLLTGTFPGFCSDNPPPAENHNKHENQPDIPTIGVDEKIGEMLDLSAWFLDENGNRILLKEYITKPTVILPGYNTCPKSCSFLLASLTTALNDVTFTPGKDFQVLFASFAEDETPAMAKDNKRNYLKILEREIADRDWLFLTGTRDNIFKLTQSMGYTFIKNKDNTYIHANALIVVSKKGQIIRYLYGPRFQPFDIGMAISEAEKETPGISIKKALTFCFDYDPENKRYVFKTFKIAGTAILLMLSAFFIFLVLFPSKRRK
jgi:protein SCO1/2